MLDEELIQRAFPNPEYLLGMTAYERPKELQDFMQQQVRRIADHYAKEYASMPDIHKGPHPPKIGDTIYVPTALYLSHGEDDVVGGLAEVSKVRPGSNYVGVEVKEHPGHVWSWEYLLSKQGELRAQFGTSRAYPDPDLNPLTNDGDNL